MRTFTSSYFTFTKKSKAAVLNFFVYLCNPAQFGTTEEAIICSRERKTDVILERICR